MTTPREEEPLYPFEDIIDGYFPLQVSLMQMLERLGSDLAYVEITHAPIMQIENLPHDAPVPLNIRDGRAGVIDQLHLRVAADGAISGAGTWRWLDGSSATEPLDPMTRLAEPAFLSGFCLAPAHPRPTEIAALSEAIAGGLFGAEAPDQILPLSEALDPLQLRPEVLPTTQPSKCD